MYKWVAGSVVGTMISSRVSIVGQVVDIKTSSANNYIYIQTADNNEITVHCNVAGIVNGSIVEVKGTVMTNLIIDAALITDMGDFGKLINNT